MKGEIMKRILFSVFVLTLFVILGCNVFATQKTNGDLKMDKDSKILVVYYSLSGNTEAVAKEIQKQTSADIFELETVMEYPSEYRAQTQQAKKEIEAGYKPELKNKIDNIEQYDVVFIGSPCWWSTYAPAVSTFLADYDLSGKILVPFMTHGGSGMGRSESDMKKAAPKSTVVDGLAIRGSRANDSEEEVKEFIDKLDLKK